jgi:uncharacterized protein (TIGR02391 family)
MAGAVSEQFENLCSKQFQFERRKIYEKIDRDVLKIKKWFESRNAGMSPDMAEQVVDLLLERYDSMLGAFDNAYLGKWRDPAKGLSESEFQWLKAKAMAVLEEESRDIARMCHNKLYEPTCSLIRFWELAGVTAREKNVQFLQKIEILHLEKTQGDLPKISHVPPPPPPAKAAVVNWDLLHPKVVKVAKSRFESGHFADAVEAALKELNDVVKTIVRVRMHDEHDGADLMNRAFSPKDPVIKLCPQETETGRDIQKGYMQIFAGTMIGVRNPKAHSNIQIGPKTAIHLLFLASLLFFKIDEALNNSTASGGAQQG